MGLFSTLGNIVTLPVSMVADIVVVPLSWGDRSLTAENVKRISEDC